MAYAIYGKEHLKNNRNRRVSLLVLVGGVGTNRYLVVHLDTSSTGFLLYKFGARVIESFLTMMGAHVDLVIESKPSYETRN